MTEIRKIEIITSARVYASGVRLKGFSPSSFIDQKFDLAQGAVLSAIGLLSEERKKETESGFQDLPLVAAACQFVNYALPLPLSCQRNQILVIHFNI